MHTGKRGKSGSKHLPSRDVPAWMQTPKEEVTQLITQLAKQGKTASTIGVILRDQHGIPSVKAILGKSISQVLEENGLGHKFPEDLLNLLERAVSLQKHMSSNKKDLHNRRALELTESKIRRLSAYYRRTGRLDWTYKPEEAALLLKS